VPMSAGIATRTAARPAARRESIANSIGGSQIDHVDCVARDHGLRNPGVTRRPVSRSTRGAQSRKIVNARHVAQAHAPLEGAAVDTEDDAVDGQQRLAATDAEGACLARARVRRGDPLLAAVDEQAVLALV